MGELVRLGLVQNRGLVLAAAALGVVSQQDFIDWESVGRTVIGAVGRLPDTFEPRPIDIALLVAGGVLLILIVLTLLSIAFAILRYHGFTLSRDGNDLRTRFGLLTRVAMTVPRRRIQRVWTRESPLHRLFKRLSIRLDTAGGAGGGGNNAAGGGVTSRQWLTPLAPPTQLTTLVQEAMPEFPSQPLEIPPWNGASRNREALRELPEPWRPVARRAWKRLFRRMLILFTLLALPLNAFSWWALLLLPLLWLYAYYAAQRMIERSHFALTDEAIAAREGWWSRKLSIVPFEKIQAVVLSASPFDRRAGMKTLRIDTAGSGQSYGIEIRYLDEQTATILADHLYRESARRRFRWV